MSYGSGLAVGMGVGMMLGDMLSEAEPIDFHCKNCDHSYTKHRDGYCQSGLFNKCNCTLFQIKQEEIDQANKEIQDLKDILFKHYNDATQLQQGAQHD